MEAPNLKELLNTTTADVTIISEYAHPETFAEIEAIPDHKFTVCVKAGLFFIYRDLDSDYGRSYVARRFTNFVGFL